MNGGTGNFLLEKAEAFALRIARLYQHLSDKGENSATHTSSFILHICSRWFDGGKNGKICGIR